MLRFWFSKRRFCAQNYSKPKICKSIFCKIMLRIWFFDFKHKKSAKIFQSGRLFFGITSFYFPLMRISFLFTNSSIPKLESSLP